MICTAIAKNMNSFANSVDRSCSLTPPEGPWFRAICRRSARRGSIWPTCWDRNISSTVVPPTCGSSMWTLNKTLDESWTMWHLWPNKTLFVNLSQMWRKLWTNIRQVLKTHTVYYGRSFLPQFLLNFSTCEIFHPILNSPKHNYLHLYLLLSMKDFMISTNFTDN